MKKIHLLLIVFCLYAFHYQSTAQTVTDVEGHVYNTITLGTQVWMQENLKTGKYRNGATINTDWTQVPYVGTCSDYAHVQSYDTTYGMLYNFYAVEDARNICPVGFHVPSSAEWLQLKDFLGGWSVAGGKMKETGTQNWQTPNTGADNSSGFTARPGGYVSNAAFYAINVGGNWWSNSIDSGNMYAIGYGLSFNSAAMTTGESIKSYGASVRCVGNVAAGIGEIKTIEFELYPNPASNELNISMPATFDRIEVYSVTGILVAVSAKNKINIAAFAAGNYFVKVYAGNKIGVRQFIKQ